MSSPVLFDIAHYTVLCLTVQEKDLKMNGPIPSIIY